MSAICSEISSVALAVWLASDLTSDATTAKPRPASPARAASMVAFSAKRLVCAAMVLIRPTTSPIRAADFAKPLDGVVGFPRPIDGAAGDAGGVRRLPADIVDRRAQFVRRGSHAVHAHRGLAGGLLRDLNARVGLVGDVRQAGRGRPHLAGGVVQLVQRLAHHAPRIHRHRLRCSLTRGGAGVAFALLLFDPELVGGLLLEGFQRAGQCSDLVPALRISGIDGEIAGGDFQHGVANRVQRLDDAAA